MEYEASLPQNILAEQGVLGAIQYAPSCIALIADRLKDSDFQGIAYRHPEIWQAMKWLYDHEQTIDLVALVARLKVLGVDEIRNKPPTVYLGDLWRLAMENGTDVEQDAQFVKNASLRRQMNRVLEKMAVIIRQEEDAELALEQCEALLYAIGSGIEQDDLTPLTAVMEEFLLDLDTRHREHGKLTGVSTGLDDLDFLLGGLQKQEMIVLGGQPGEGKTSLLLNILYHSILVEQKHVAFFSLEMSRKDLARRLVSMDTGINSQYLRTRILRDEQWEAVIDAATSEKRLASAHTFIDESGDLTPSTMRTKMRRHESRYGKLDLIVIDYLQLMQGDEEPENRHETETQELSRISRALKKLAKSFDVPVLVVVSLRKTSDGKRPELADVRGSGAIAFDSDVAMFIMRSREREGYSIVNIEKHRNGPTGDITLKFDATLTRFSSVEEGDNAPEGRRPYAD